MQFKTPFILPLNILKPELNGWHFADDMLRYIFAKEVFLYFEFVCKSLIGNMSVLVQVTGLYTKQTPTWWRHQTETFSALPVTGEFPAQTPVTRRFDVFFDLCLNKRLSKQWWGWWFEAPLRSFWRHYNEAIIRSYNDPAHWYLHSSSGVKDSYKM